MNTAPYQEQLTASLKESRRAVIDIGSNSVRLVLFNGPARTPLPILNEKSLCGLGRGQTEHGKLNPDAVSDAMRVVRRFRDLLDAHGNPPTSVIATAAVRDAEDGAEFIKRVEAHGFEVNLLSGEQEASYAALGVVSLKPGATGIVGDMGGGSLELSALKDGKIGGMGSLSIGPFRLMQQSDGNMRKAEKIAKAALADIDWLDKKRPNIFYAVGGAWRTIARMHMALRNYPLSVLHHYTMTAHEVSEICTLIESQSRDSLQNMPGISRRRLDTLPYAAMVLKHVIKVLGTKQVVISAGGVREGVLFSSLSKKIQHLDPVIAFSRYLAQRFCPDPAMGAAINPILSDVFSAMDPDHDRLRLMICIMTDIAAYFHPNHRGRQAFDMALGLPIVGLTHAERVMAALALFRRYEGRNANAPDRAAVKLLAQDDVDYAETLGLAIRFFADLSPKVSTLFDDCRLATDKDSITFSLPMNKKSLMGELPEKRFMSLAARMKLEPKIHYTE